MKREQQCGPVTLYVMEMEGTKFVKIGIAKNVGLRRQGLQNANPFTLKVIFTKTFDEWMDGKEMETRAHHGFCRQRVSTNGRVSEWFLLDNEMRDELRLWVSLMGTPDFDKDFRDRLRLSGVLSDSDLFDDEVAI